MGAFECLPEFPVFLNDATFFLRAIRLLNTRPMDPPSPELEPGSTDPQQAGTIDFSLVLNPLEVGFFRNEHLHLKSASYTHMCVFPH
jgi:hypothetical protein